MGTGLALIALQIGFRAWALSTSWFYTDDFTLLRTARESSLSWTYLLLPENGHLMPATRALFLAFANGPGLDWGVASAVTLVLQLAASLSALWMLITLFGPRWGVLALLVVYLTSAMTAQATLWWVSSINQTPVLMTFFLAVGAWVRYLRSGRWAPLIGTAAAVGWGLLFFQKALFVLPLLAIIAVAYFATGGLAQRLAQVTRGYWRSVLILGGTACAFTAYYVVRVPSAGSRERDEAWAELAWGMVGQAFAPGVLGGPLRWDSRTGGAWADPPTWFLILAWGILGAVVGGSMLTRHRAGRAWLLLVAHYLILIGTIGVSRASVFGADIGTAYRLQTEGIAVAVLAVGLAWLPLVGATESSAVRERSRFNAGRHSALFAVPIAVSVSFAGTMSWVSYVQDWQDVNDSKRFATTVSEGAARFPGLELVDREVPRSILSDFTRPYNRLSDIADILAPGAQFPDASNRLWVVSDSGALHQALIEPLARSTQGPVPECGWAVPPGASVRVPMRLPDPFEPLWMRIPYYVADDGTVTVSTAGETVSIPVRSGPNSIYVAVNDEVDGVRFEDLTTQGALCVDIIELGRPVPGPEL